MDVFQGQYHEGSSQTELEAFRGELLEFINIQSTGSPESVDRFWQDHAAVLSQFLVSLPTVLHHNFSYFRVSNCVLVDLFTLFLILKP